MITCHQKLSITILITLYFEIYLVLFIHTCSSRMSIQFIKSEQN